MNNIKEIVHLKLLNNTNGYERKQGLKVSRPH